MAESTRRATLIITARDESSAGIGKASSSLSGFSKGLKGLNQEAGALVGRLIGPAALIGALKGSIDAAMEAQRIMTQTEAVIKSTGGAAGLTAEEIGKLAASESRLTSVDDEVIQSGQNMLLTFTNIGGETFPRATRAMQDMAVAFAQGDTSAIDLQGTAIQLGKALNDPERGLLALRRVGVNFTQSQKDAIKAMMDMNDVAGAQAIILAELEKEFGGSAEAAGTTLAGKMQKAQNAVENFGEAIGNKLIPFLGQAAEAATTLLTAGDQIDEAFNKHLKDMIDLLKTGQVTQAEFDAEMLRAAQVSGKVTNSIGLQAGGMISLNQETETQIRLARINADTYEDLGVRMLGANVATEGLVSGIESMQAALDTTETQMSMLNEVMSGAVGKEQKDYAEAQEKNREKAASLRAELEKLEKVYGSNSERVVEIRGQLHELNVAQEENTAAHEEATKRILFDIAARQLAMDGLTSREVEALRLLSLEWGLQDKATADAVANVLNATLQLAEDDSIDNFINSVDDAREGTAKLGASIRDLPTSKEITITTNYITTGDRPTGISEERGRQFGGPVFRGQPYLVGESGPEAFVPSRSGYILNREDAMAALRGANVRGGDTYNITINDQMSSALWMEEFRRRRIQSLEGQL